MRDKRRLKGVAQGVKSHKSLCHLSPFRAGHSLRINIRSAAGRTAGSGGSNCLGLPGGAFGPGHSRFETYQQKYQSEAGNWRFVFNFTTTVVVVVVNRELMVVGSILPANSSAIRCLNYSLSLVFLTPKSGVVSEKGEGGCQGGLKRHKKPNSIWIHRWFDAGPRVI